ncbi:MAG: ABC transporter substrate-binding protein [Nocardioides sp.]
MALMLLTACLGGGDDSGGGGGGDGEVEIMYGFSQEQSDAFEASMKDFLDEEGINVKFSPTPDFDKLIRSRVAGNNLPDIAIFPQPGITLDIARSGKLADLRDIVDIDELESQIVPGILNAATDADGAVFAAPMSISLKSLVWYPKPEFEAAGYEVPATHEELLALTDQIREDGTAPWCVGIESQAATGWPATDWYEDYVLRVGGTELYDQWVSHEIPFDDPQIEEAGKLIEEIWYTEGNVFGGRKSIASTSFQTAANPMFSDKPGCFLHRQASFLAQPGTLPDEVISDLDNRVGVFPLPPVDEAGGLPLMGGGDLAGLFSQDDEDSIKVLEYMIGPDFKGWPDQSGYISPQKDYDLELQPNQTMKDISEIAYAAEEFRFDGSDTMPGEVGSGSFWRGMVEWVQGKALADVLTDIE